MKANDDTLNPSDYKPTLSVIIPLYNHEKFIREAVYSVLEQSFSDFELIIINDGSTDRSEEVVKDIEDERITYLCQENRGAPNVINRGIGLSKGRYISILNSDDVYHKDRFEKLLHILEADGSLAAVFSRIENIDEYGNSLGLIGPEENWINHDPETSFKGRDNVFLNLLAGNFLRTTSNLFCRKSAFDRIGLFSDLRYAHDYEFFLRLCFHCNVHFVDEPLLKYRTHSANTIKENEAEVRFEVGLALANFFLKHDLGRFVEDPGQRSSAMARFFNSMNTHGADRMILTLLIVGTGEKEKKEALEILFEDRENPFRKACVDRFNTSIDIWRYAEEVRNKLDEANQRIIDRDQKLDEANEKISDMERRLSETDRKLAGMEQRLSEVSGQLREEEMKNQSMAKEMKALLDSRSFFLYRALTPLKKMFGRR